MPDLSFQVVRVAVIPYAAAPLLGFQLRIGNAGAEPIDTIALRCQIQIEAARRHYTPQEQQRLSDLFGEPNRWGQTLRTMLWTHVSMVVPAFTGETICELPVPCTFDFNVGATKYFYGLSNGAIPLCFQFSGTIFYEREDGALQATPVSWVKEAKFELSVKIWKEMMELYYPNSAWLRLPREAFDRLYQYKILNGILTWEEVLERISPALQEAAHP